MAFEYLQDRRLHHLAEKSLPVFGELHSERVFLDVQRELPVFQCVPVASCPVTGHHWKRSGSVLALFLQVFLCILMTPL